MTRIRTKIYPANPKRLTSRRATAHSLHHRLQLLLLRIVVAIEQLDQLGALFLLQFGDLVNHRLQTLSLAVVPNLLERGEIVSVFGQHSSVRYSLNSVGIERRELIRIIFRSTLVKSFYL